MMRLEVYFTDLRSHNFSDNYALKSDFGLKAEHLICELASLVVDRKGRSLLGRSEK